MLQVGKAGLILPFMALALNTQAQKKQFTMAEAVNGMSGSLAPKGVKEPTWRPGTNQFSYLIGNKYIIAEINSGKFDTTIYDDAALKSRVSSKWLKKFSSFSQKDSIIKFQDYDLGYPRHILNDAQNVHCIANPYRVAYTVNNNLWINTDSYDKEDENIAVTSDNNPNIINGQAVHRNEFGIIDGMFWSPKGNYLAYYRMDQTMVNDYPVIDWSTVPAHDSLVKYPMAGGKSHVVTLRVYEPKSQKTIELKTGEGKDHYLTCVTWSPDEKYIYVGILNRKQNHLWLNQYDAQTGEKVKTLFEETDEKYVEPQHPLSFIPGSNTEFIWWSQRDGFMHLYLCDMKSNKMKCLTPGNYVVNELIGFNAKRNEVLLTSAKQDPREKHGYAVNWKTGKMRQLDDYLEIGIHNYIASDDGEYLYEVYSGELSDQAYWNFAKGYDIVDIPDEQKAVAKRSDIRSISGDVVTVLMDSLNPLTDYNRPTVRSVEMKADDGTKLYGKLILPTNFDDQKKYPVIVYLYNGPHVQQIKNSFPESGNLWYDYMAQHGYVVWTMDGRGSSNRGQKFEQAVFRQLGTVEMEDQMVGVNFLKSLPFVDSTRLGIHGWSFGGFMTTSFMLHKPGVFKVAVAGGPVMDWSMYEIMYGERYMDTPEENPEGYANNNLLTKVKNLKGKLMLIHGTQDATVVWQQSINFIKKSVDENVQVDYFVYPGYEHNVRGKDRVHLMQKVTNYFDQNL